MEIKPTYISFEQAKLLKEKKIEIDTDEVIFYRDEVNNIEEHQIKNRDVIYYDNNFLYKVIENEYRTYHQWEFIEWLGVNHGIWVVVTPVLVIKAASPIKFDYEIYYFDEIKYGDEVEINYLPSNTPQGAYLAAFDYILKELI